jgi:hypothetical protein
MDPVTRMLMMGAAGAAKDIDFISSSINQATDTNTVTAPANIQDGDLLLAIGFNDANRTVSSYAGGFSERFLSAASENSLFVASKIAASESGNYTFNWSGTGRSIISILVYRNATDDARLIGSITRANSNTSTASSISPLQRGALIGAFCHEDPASVNTAPAGMAQRAIKNDSNLSLAIYDLVPNPSGATGNKTLTWSSATQNSGLLLQIYRR